MPVALTIPVLFTIIVNLTKVLLPTTVTLAVLLTVKTTGVTFTLAFAETIVLFSSDITFTVLFHGPTAFDLAIIHNSVALFLAKLGIVQVVV